MKRLPLKLLRHNCRSIIGHSRLETKASHLCEAFAREGSSAPKCRPFLTRLTMRLSLAGVNSQRRDYGKGAAAAIRPGADIPELVEVSVVWVVRGLSPPYI